MLGSAKGCGCASFAGAGDGLLVPLGARRVAECVARGECCRRRGLLRRPGPGLLRGQQGAGPAGRRGDDGGPGGAGDVTLGVNLLAVEMPGRTFFEMRQMLRLLCAAVVLARTGWPCTLQELDGHAHR